MLAIELLIMTPIYYSYETINSYGNQTFLQAPLTERLHRRALMV
jgi:hypothetical protein